jgi:hypothetical protein
MCVEDSFSETFLNISGAQYIPYLTQVVVFCFFGVFLTVLGFYSRLRACKAGALPLEPHLQSILLCLFWRWGLSCYFPRLAENRDSQISASQVARITGVSHWHPASLSCFMFVGEDPVDNNLNVDSSGAQLQKSRFCSIEFYQEN